MYNDDLFLYLKNEEPSPEFTFNSKTYKIKKDYRISVAMAGAQKKNKQDTNPTDFIKVVEEFFIESVSKDFLEEIRKADVSEMELVFLFKYIQNRRGGLPHERAIEEARKAEETDPKKN